MSSMKFSDAQNAAITAKGSNYIVSAGAGSGKTAVLTERIYRIAKEINSLDPFLVLTFTKLAAGEMKKRVRDKLLADPETHNLATEVDNAHIETFDAFSLFLAQKYFYKLNVNQDITVVEASIIDIKRKQVLNNLFNKLYKEENADFLNIIKQYCLKDDEGIRQLITSIIAKGDKKADKYSYFNELKNKISHSFIKSALNDFVIIKHKQIKFLLSKLDKYPMEDSDDESEIIDFLNELLNFNDYDSLVYALLNRQFPKKGKTQTNDKPYRDAIAGYYKKKIVPSKDALYSDSKLISQSVNGLKPFVNTIIDIVIEIEQTVDLYKKEHNAYAFSDISRMIIKLLEDKEVCEEISKSFDYIMIDEYQDTNDIQEAVINKISHNNVYMVGDVKQSIYKFRGADCHIFQEKYLNYKNQNGGIKIDLNTSYRSRKEVVDFINDAFINLLTPELNVIDYKDGHNFGFGQKAYEPNSNYNTEIYHVNYDKAYDLEQNEINLIINDIKTKIDNGFQVFDLKTKSYRNVTYKDFAIIIDRKSAFDEYKRAFSKVNIPLNAYSEEELFGSDVVCAIRSLVKMLYYSLNNEIDSNEYRHAFMSVARSFLYSYDDGKLHDIYLNKTFLLEEFAQKIELIKESLRFASIKNILISLYENFEIYQKFPRIRQYYPNSHKAEHLLALAESLDALGFTLKDFIDYFDDLNKEKLDIDFKDNDVRDNSVTLINIHQSKGLEYRIIYYPGLGKAFNNEELKSGFLCSEKYGIVIPYKNEYTNILNYLTKYDEKHQEFEEKLRLLYVAITRAQEKIIILRPYKETKSVNIHAPDSVNSLEDILSLIDDSLAKYKTNKELDLSIPKNIIKSSISYESPKITLDSINIPAIEINTFRASKIRKDEDNIQNLLNFGEEVHFLLENVNFGTKDLSFIPSHKMRHYIANIINNDLFLGVKDSSILKEYKFFDEVNNCEGIIDALIIKEDEIDIIDYKLKNLNDAAYDKQLRTYKSYIKQITNLPIKMYLLAAISGEVREVKDE